MPGSQQPAAPGNDVMVKYIEAGNVHHRFHDMSMAVVFLSPYAGQNQPIPALLNGTVSTVNQTV